MAFEFLNKEDTENYMLGSLYYRAGDPSERVAAKKMRRALRWYQMILSGVALEGSARIKFLRKSQLLFCFVYDIGYLLLEMYNFKFRLELEEIDPDLITLYSRGVLERLLTDESFTKAAEWLSGDPSQDDLIAWLIGKALDSILQARPLYNFSVATSTVKNLNVAYSFFDYETAFEENHGPQDPSLKEAILHMSDLHKQRSTRPIFSGETIETVKYWKAFKNRFAREAGQKILQWSSIFPNFDPRRMRVVHEEQLETRLPQEGPYPMGGYTGITARGKLESLLPSEMVYMDISPFEEDDISMFDIKHVFKDLLYFEREGGKMSRIKRVVHIVVDPSKHRLPLAQGIYGLYAIYGLLVSLIKNLIKALPHALEVHLHILRHAKSDNKWINIELAILQTLLEWEIMHGYATISTPREIDLRSLGERNTRVYGISIYGGEEGLPGIVEGERESSDIWDPKILVWQILGTEGGGKDWHRTSWPEEAIQLKEHFAQELNITHDMFLRWILGAP